MVELLPCPFCGSTELKIEDYTDKVYGFWDYMIKCHCGVRFHSPSTAVVDYSIPGKFVQTRNKDTMKSAYDRMIKNWNTRTPLKEGVSGK